MASTYTTNTGIEKPGTGEQSGSWGTTTNTNFDIIDAALNGQVSIVIATDTDLLTNDGSIGNGTNPVVILTGTPGSGFELRVTPTDQEKLFVVRNDTNGTCTVVYKGVTASGSNSVEIAAGKTKMVTGDGGGSSGVFKELLTNETDLVNDTTPQLGGNLDVNGNSIVSTSNGDITLAPNGTGVVVLSSTDLTLGDNDKIKVGAGTDLEIYHDATDSFIENNTGELNIQGDGITLRSDTGTETFIAMDVNDGVDLYFNNSKKLETTNTGVTVTGTLAATAVTGDGSGLTGVTGVSSVSNTATVTSEGGSATPVLVQGLAKAWANFNGTGTPAFRDSLNGSSITDVASGLFGVNYTNNMNNANYSVVARAALDLNANPANGVDCDCAAASTSQARIGTANTVGNTDFQHNYVTVHGDLA